MVINVLLRKISAISKVKYFSAPRILCSIAKCMSDKPRKEYSTDFPTESDDPSLLNVT